MTTYFCQSSPTCRKAISANSSTECVSTGPYHVIVRLRLLQHQPHRLHVVPGKAPVPLGVQIAQPQLICQAKLDAAPRSARFCG